MSDATEDTATEDGEVTTKINYEQDFLAIWANAFAECGDVNIGIDLLAAAEGKVALDLDFSTMAGGIVTEVCFAGGLEVDLGTRLHVVDDLSARLDVGDAEAIVSDARALLNMAELKVFTMERRMNELTGQLDAIESGLVDIDESEMQVTV